MPPHEALCEQARIVGTLDNHDIVRLPRQQPHRARDGFVEGVGAGAGGQKSENRHREKKQPESTSTDSTTQHARTSGLADVRARWAIGAGYLNDLRVISGSYGSRRPSGSQTMS